MNAAGGQMLMDSARRADERARREGRRPVTDADIAETFAFLGNEAAAFLKSKAYGVMGMDLSAKYAGGMQVGLEDGPDRLQATALIKGASDKDLFTTLRNTDKRIESGGGGFFGPIDRDSTSNAVFAQLHTREGENIRLQAGRGLLSDEAKSRGLNVPGLVFGLKRNVLAESKLPPRAVERFRLAPESVFAGAHEATGEYLLAAGVAGFQLPVKAHHPEEHAECQKLIKQAEGYEIAEVFKRTIVRGDILQKQYESLGQSMTAKQLGDLVMTKNARICLNKEAHARGLELEGMKPLQRNKVMNDQSVELEKANRAAARSFAESRGY